MIDDAAELETFLPRLSEFRDREPKHKARLDLWRKKDEIQPKDEVGFPCSMRALIA